LNRTRAAAVLLLLVCTDLHAADLVRIVRYKLSAGDLASGEAAAEEYRRTTGVDAEYLDAVGWLARGAQMLGRREEAAGYAAEVRKAIPAEDPALLVPFGAAIEVEGRLRLTAEGRGAALRYWEMELARLYAKYTPKGLGVLAPTRLYGGGADSKDATPEQESAQIEKFWAENYSGLSAVPRPVDTETMVRYGVSATPTYALVDGKGFVRLYAPTRLTEADLSRRIESLLAESDAPTTR
jgi:hypothetical protein